MTKKIIQDVVIKKGVIFAPKPEVKIAQKQEEPKKTSNPINLSSDKISQNPFLRERVAVPSQENYLPAEWSKEKSGGSFKKFFKWLFFLFLIGSVFFVVIKMVSVFSTVSIKITPKQKILPVNETLEASGQEELDYMIFPDSAVKSIPGSGKEELQQKATGVVVIFNNNTKAQLLVTETRLESPDGKIYKTEKKLTIPANGSVEVNVFADKPGKEYNIGLTDFKLPGFKGNPKYETVIGRSKTTMNGGYVGQASTLSDETFNKAKEELRSELSQKLKSFIEKNVRAGFLLYPESVKIEFATSTENPKVGDLNKNFEIKELATITAYSIKKDAIIQKISEAHAKELVPANPQGFSIINLEKLGFALKGISEDGNKIEFAIKGSATFVWNIDKNSLVDELRNTSPANYKNVLTKQAGIESAEIIFSPSWWKLIPKNDSRVKYEEILPN